MKRLSVILLTVCMGLSLAACTAPPQNAVLTRLTFQRGHGSMWGNQFYIEVCPQQIILAQYIPAGQTELVTLEQLPIGSEAWQMLQEAVNALELKQEKTSFLSQLWKSKKVDGGEFRKLSLQWENTQDIAYRWVESPESAALETLLESLIIKEAAK